MLPLKSRILGGEMRSSLQRICVTQSVAFLVARNNALVKISQTYGLGQVFGDKPGFLNALLLKYKKLSKMV